MLWLGLACTWSPDVPPAMPSVAPPSEAGRGDAPELPPSPAPPAELDDAGLFRPLPASMLTDGQRAEIQALESLGYVDGAVPAGASSGVIVHDPARVAPGLNLWASGHAPQASLMAADGTIVHTWRRSWSEVFGEGALRGKARGTRYWRRVEPLDDGGLLVVFEGHGLVRLDRSSNVAWSQRIRAHHDLVVQGDTVLVLAREGGVVPYYDDKRAVLDDRILTLSLADGTIQSDVSLLRALRDTPWATWLPEPGATRGDVLHTNSLDVVAAPVPGVPAIQPGQVLVSFRTIHGIAVVDLAAPRVVWGVRGPWRGQHDAQLLDNGNLLLFDNFGAGGGHGSAIRELSLPGLEAAWTYEGSAQAPFSSPFFGMVQRLPNGNTLVTDSWVGRAFEVTPEGQTVWAFVNPHRVTGDDGTIYGAVIPQLTRVAAP